MHSSGPGPIGVLLIDKPRGCTSHDVVHRIRRKFGTKRVGHAGTLDPLATGLLVVAVGPATRFLRYMDLEPKGYVARVLFGVQTTSYDAEGQVTEQNPVPASLAAELEKSIPKFTGTIQQVPPMYSAIKLQGRPLYEYARRGEALELQERTVQIGRLEVLEVDGPAATLLIECSAGTYVRSLAHDLGMAIGCGAHLVDLVRTQVGRFRLEDATSLDDAHPDLLIDLKDALAPMPMAELNAEGVSDIRMGRAVPWKAPDGVEHVGLVTTDGEVIGIAAPTDGKLQPVCVIPGVAHVEV